MGARRRAWPSANGTAGTRCRTSAPGEEPPRRQSSTDSRKAMSKREQRAELPARSVHGRRCKCATCRDVVPYWTALCARVSYTYPVNINAASSHGSRSHASKCDGERLGAGSDPASRWRSEFARALRGLQPRAAQESRGEAGARAGRQRRASRADRRDPHRSRCLQEIPRRRASQGGTGQVTGAGHRRPRLTPPREPCAPPLSASALSPRDGRNPLVRRNLSPGCSRTIRCRCGCTTRRPSGSSMSTMRPDERTGTRARSSSR